MQCKRITSLGPISLGHPAGSRPNPPQMHAYVCVYVHIYTHRERGTHIHIRTHTYTFNFIMYMHMYIYVCVWWGWCWAPECSGKALVRERHGPNPFEHNVEPGVGCPCVNVDLEPALANLKMSPTFASDATRTSESWACCSTLGGWLCESLKPLMKGRVRPQLATVQTLLGPLARFFPSQSPQTMCACTKGRLGTICLF